MAVRQRMDLRQTQTLVMTPQLQQAIKLLELSSQELTAYVEREIEQNPLLERDDATGDGGTDLEALPGDDTAPAAASVSDPLDASEFAAAAMMPDAPESPLDVDYDNLWTNDGSDAPTAPSLLGTGGRGRSDADDAYVGSGTTVTRDVPPGALAVSRVAQRNIEGWVARRRALAAAKPPARSPAKARKPATRRARARRRR